MKRYCLNSKARKQIKDTLITTCGILAIIIFILFLCAFPFISTLVILLEPAYKWSTLIFIGLFITLSWLSLGIQQLGKWFITNLEEC